MEHDDINTIYDRISKILKNDQKHSYKTMGQLIVNLFSGRADIERYYDLYPPLLDVAELGANLEHVEANHGREVIDQIKYKMQQLLVMLPDLK